MNLIKLMKMIIGLILLILAIKYLGSLILILIVSYILFSMLLPLKNKIQKILKIKNHSFPSFISLLFPSLVLFLVLMYIFPVIITQLNSLTYLSYEDVFDNIIQQFPVIDNLIVHLGGKKDILQSIEDTMYQIININIIAQWSSILLNNFSKIFINLLIIFFITFHLLKDETLINQLMSSFISNERKQDIEEMNLHVKTILGKYFRGLIIDVILVIFINSTILSILNVKNSILIGILSGIMNILPYVGPLITLLIGLFLGVSGDIINAHYELIDSTVLKILITLVSVNIIDGTIILPFIFSNVLKAHPLEIFLVIISAGMLGGILWMMLAIPLYVILKVVTKEIMNRWKNWN